MKRYLGRGTLLFIAALVLGGVLGYGDPPEATTMPAGLVSTRPAGAGTRPARPEALTYTADNLPARLDFHLDPGVAWTQLPRNISGACNSPDGRVWLMVDVPRGIVTPEGLRALIKREYSDPMPQMSLVRPVLFEPGGRVWFGVMTATSNPVDAPIDLIGYDGKTFIEKGGIAQKRITNVGAGAGRLGAAACVYADGRAFFSLSDEVLVFDGATWTSHEMPARGPYHGNSPCRLYVEPDGLGVIRVPVDANDVFYRWRGGEWTHFGGDAVAKSDRYVNVVFSAAPVSDGVLVVASGGFKRVPFKAEPKPATVAELITAVQSPDEGTRERAGAELIARGRNAAPEVKAAADASQDEDVRKTLLELLRQMGSSAQRPTIVMGTYELSTVNNVIPLGNGRTVVMGHQVVEKPPQVAPRGGMPRGGMPRGAVENPPPLESTAVVLLRDTDGNVKLLQKGESAEMFNTMKQTPGTGDQVDWPLAREKLTRLWCGHEKSQMGCVDLSSGRLLQQVPSFGFDSVLAVAGDGTMFLRAEDHIITYQPAGKDLRRGVKPAEHLAIEDWCAIGSDGNLWFVQRRTGKAPRALGRYDGEKVEMFPDAKLPDSRPDIAVGQGGVLLYSNRSYSLVTSKGVVTGAVLQDLIAENAGEFARTFAGRKGMRGRGQDVLSIQADPAGNVWVVRGDTGEMKVFAGGKWLDVEGPLSQAGDFRGAVTKILSVGDTGKMLLFNERVGRDFAQREQPNAFLASVQEGKIVAEKLPRIENVYPLGQAVYDTGGNPWVEVVQTGRMGIFCGAQITAKGVGDKEPWGSVRLVDAAGNLWTVHGLLMQDRLARVYHGDHFAAVDMSLLPDSGMWNADNGVWNAPGGFVCWDTPLGLRNVRAVDDGKAMTVEEGETIQFLELNAAHDVVGVSSRGFAVVKERTNAGNPILDILIYPLKRP